MQNIFIDDNNKIIVYLIRTQLLCGVFSYFIIGGTTTDIAQSSIPYNVIKERKNSDREMGEGSKSANRNNNSEFVVRKMNRI